MASPDIEHTAGAGPGGASPPGIRTKVRDAVLDDAVLDKEHRDAASGAAAERPRLPGLYCNSLGRYSRFLTREVMIGDVPMGGTNPIRIQSMTTTDTMDTSGTVEQTIRMVEAGCEYVRITAPSVREAENLADIRKELRRRGCTVPLIADIHFTPNAAETAARIVEKVRVNPGNFADKKRFETIAYTPSAYEAELDRIRKRFSPLVKICKEYGTAMRIGTNHGSLSDRIMSWYGDTPRGMVESAMEFMRICADLDYHQLVISMKASNPQVMVQAYRLLVETMVAEGMNYPLHLGVTEAGDGEDGRIKSAVGIGTLLEDGLGDTIRVSLTEEPEFEAPVAIALAGRYRQREENDPGADNGEDAGWNGFVSANSGAAPAPGEHTAQPGPEKEKAAPEDSAESALPEGFSPYAYNKRSTAERAAFIGGRQVPRVVLDLSGARLGDPSELGPAGYRYSPLLDKYNMAEQSVDFVYLGDRIPDFSMPGNLKQLYNYGTWLGLRERTNSHPLFTLEEFVHAPEKDPSLNLVRITCGDLDTAPFRQLVPDAPLVFVLETSGAGNGPAERGAAGKGITEQGGAGEGVAEQGIAEQRAFFFRLMEAGLDTPVIIRRPYPGLPDGPEAATLAFQLYAATDCGALLVDGLGDGIWVHAPGIPAATVVSTSFGILQATRSRISKTEYISCPSCGRTMFDLQETTQLIRSRTGHLKGVKIGIMGCIVNGPGEMADADYGYVGTGPGRITLYRGKQVVRKNVSAQDAVDELISLIREDGNWIDP